MKKLLFALSFLFSSSLLANTIIVPFTPGGAIDKMAREFSFFVKQKTKENISVENKAGAGSLLGTQHVLNSRNENTLLITSSAFFHLLIDEKIKKEDFKLVSVFGRNPYVLVSTNSKSITCDDIKDRNKKFFVGTAGKGSASDTAAEILISNFQNFTVVPYKGISQVMLDLIPGRIDFTFTSGLKDKDNVKTIATTTTKDVYKNIINWKKCLDIDVDYYGEYLLLVPSGTSDDVIRKMNALAIEFVTNHETIEKFLQDGIQPLFYNLKEIDYYYTSSLANWKKVSKKD